jgi:protein-S-isoprenylcysteine O-methyltransferase Ste14
MTDREKEHILRRVRYERRMIEARAHMLGGGIVFLCFLILFIIASFFPGEWEKFLQVPSALRIFVFGWIALVVGLVYLVSGLINYRNSAFSIAFFCDTPETAFDDVPGFF